MSAPMTVPTMWTSLRYPSGNIGRSGRSMRRQVRIADSGARPSRRKNEPGILPAAYMRSSISTVSGKKSAPGRGDLAPVAVTRTVVSPSCASTEPPARPARRPVSKETVFLVPLKVCETVWGLLMDVFPCCVSSHGGPSPVGISMTADGARPPVSRRIPPGRRSPRRCAAERHATSTGGRRPSIVVDQVVGGPVSPSVRMNRALTFPTRHGRPRGRPVLALR